jgi:hypothetical protein
MKRLLYLLPLFALLPLPAKAQAKQHSVALTCTAGANDVTFSFYRSTTSGGPYSKLTSGLASCAFTDTTGTGGTKYFYVSTGTDASGVESINSNEASATFLVNPAPPTGLAAVPN